MPGDMLLGYVRTHNGLHPGEYIVNACTCERRASMALDVSKVKKYYDRFGSEHDSQGFYEDPPIE
jgi:hypothetical protein